MKPLSFAVKASVLAVALVLLNPRAGAHHSGQFWVISCSLQVGGSVGPNGIGYAYIDHSNPFSGLAIKAFGC